MLCPLGEQHTSSSTCGAILILQDTISHLPLWIKYNEGELYLSVPSQVWFSFSQLELVLDLNFIGNSEDDRDLHLGSRRKSWTEDLDQTYKFRNKMSRRFLEPSRFWLVSRPALGDPWRA
jgi:hypothetical protein